MYLLRLAGTGAERTGAGAATLDIVGSSPESLVTVTGTRAGLVARLHPIAGTRPRGGTEAKDAELAAELVGSEKERAEHIMLVDLGRNDLGRVCEPGTVRVVEFGAVERFSHVMHIVSTVVGEVRADLDAVDVLTACYPAGTLTGRPEGPGDGAHRRARAGAPRASTGEGSATSTSAAISTSRSPSVPR